MKKKVLAVALALSALALILGAGTIAYFTDKETVTNTFTLGKVDITLKEFDHNGNSFASPAKIAPSENGKAKSVTPKNAVVVVEPDSEAAWVWVEILIPSALYNSKTQNNENNNGLHYNQFTTFMNGYADSTNPNAVTAATTFPDDHHQWSLMTYIKEETINGKSYSLLRTTHKDIVEAGNATSPAISQVYLDDDVKYENGKYYIPADGTESGHATAFTEYDGDWELIVNAYAVQADGFATIDAAIAAYAAQN